MIMITSSIGWRKGLEPMMLDIGPALTLKLYKSLKITTTTLKNCFYHKTVFTESFMILLSYKLTMCIISNVSFEKLLIRT